MSEGKNRTTHCLGSILREEVGGQESSSDALIQASKAVVGSLDDGVLEATGVLKVQVDSAVLGAVCGGGARTNVGLECIEAVGDDSLVGRGAGGDGSLRTSVTRVGGIDDGDLAWVGSSLVALGQRVGHGEDREEDSGEFGVHVEDG